MLRVGVDVPWVTAWSGEALAPAAPCPSVGGALALQQQGAPGAGRPVYSQNHLLRQRLSVRDGLCPMCGGPTPPEDRWTQTARLAAAGDLRRRGARLPAAVHDDQRLVDCGSIAPLHRRCVDASLARCPHLRGEAEIRVMRFPAASLRLPLLAPVRLPDGRTAAAVAFLQLLGVTRTLDRRWRDAA